jgi:hypothetical protein
LKPGANDPPGLPVDEKIAWLEDRRLDWNTVIVPVLRHLFPAWSDEERSGQFQPIWKRLNAVVHPSADWRLSGVNESARHIWFHFEEGLAGKLLTDASEVFALIWLAILFCFPAAATALAADTNTFRGCPQLRTVLEICP